MRCTALLVITLVFLPTTAIRGQEPVRGGPPIIDSIIIVTRDIFDSTEASRNVFFRIANALHVTTRPSVIRHELLFRVGEPYDSAKVAETERNLRGRGLFRDVEIDTVHVGDRVNVQVNTADGWTTELILNARSTGDEVSWAVGAQERNLLGTGARLGLTYRDEPDRTAVTLRGGMDRIRGTRFGVDGRFDYLSDGEVGAWQAGVPFRAFADRWAVELSGAAGRQRILQFRDGDSLETYRRRLLLQSGHLTYALGASPDGYLRLGLLGQLKREEYLLDSVWVGRGASVPDTVTGALGIFADLVDARFKVVKHYNGFDRDEDLDLSTRVTVAAWVAPDVFGYRENGIGPGVFVQLGAALGKNFARLQAAANGLFTSSGLDSGQVRIAFTAASQVIPKSATVLHVQYGARRGTPPGSEFDLGHGLGPRAFGPHAFTGDRSVWGSIEQRAFLIDEVLGILGVGFVAFLDYGGAWFADQPSRLGGDVGVGLRVGATRATGQNIGGLDLAYRFGDGVDGDRWVVSFGRGFAF
ncbi:MAG: hypothetical protein GTN78_05380 [Gemmatimonadales bacterium]|nr:hypothetical protein [Gemmatimonadales bacterium]NIN12727.1 hypothetical protein [Gemmatimonadales bacterium]NIQ99618.1 hypothetical protein [Gemmatimonadales bacterium]NIS64175.1 hypothetical protein [Gemmatimonadales bacterium]